MKIADAAARECALDPSKSFAVAAPAGSGKTELLTQRVLRLLATVEEPEEILCMTFTRKAAGEMKQRLLSALNSVSQTDVNQSNSSEANNSHQQVTYHLAKKALARDQEKNWQLLDNPNRLRIQTIDGFCLNLAQQLAVESRFGDYAEPVNDPTPLYREAIATLLLPSLEQQNPLGKAIGTLLRHLDNDLNKLEQLLINLLGKREQWLGQLFQSRGARNYLESFLNEVIEETLSEAQHLLLPYGSDLALLADYAASQLPHDKRTSPINHCLEMVGLPENNLHFVEQWQGLCELLLTKENDWRKAFNKNIGFPTETDTGDKAFAKAQKQAMAELLKQLHAVPG
ncbi:MAG: UvrD-helicase domain-containing protein, partial [Porticoccus sp.]|nr:UvrD-helicase domain-containing protein [Porticoccus sp.]